MSLIELTIIYVSCGSPFAVERLLSSKRSNEVQAVTLSLLHLLLWPAFLLIKLIRVIDSRHVSQKDDANSTLTDRSNYFVETHRDLTVLLSDPAGRRPSLNIKDLLERYSGLALLSTTSLNISSIPAPEFARISNHPLPELAARCLHRRNKIVIKRHLAAAREEFLEVVATAASDSEREETILSAAAGFIHHYDPAALSQFEDLFCSEKCPTPENMSVPTLVRFKESSAAR